MIPPAEALSRGHQAYLDTLPKDLQGDSCKCKTVPWHAVYNQVKKLPNSGDVGITVHIRCNKPANLWAYIEECESCELYYIVTKYPDRTLLCSYCDF